MTTFIQKNPTDTEIFYPSSDGEPLAESYDHVQVISTTLDILTRYLEGQQASVLANQFLYYQEGFPNLRAAPDVMVIFDVAPGGRDNYKIWTEKQVPKVIFEMTSKGTKKQDLVTKKNLYEQLGVFEYWLFDPRGEWIKEQLRGYRLQEKTYELITDNLSEPLQLRLEIEDQLIGFYRLDTGEKLLTAEELSAALAQQTEALAQQTEALAQQTEALAQEKAAKEQEKTAREQAEIAREQAISIAEQAESAKEQAEIAREQAEAKALEMEALLALYREQFGNLE